MDINERKKQNYRGWLLWQKNKNVNNRKNIEKGRKDKELREIKSLTRIYGKNNGLILNSYCKKSLQD
jgi:hypothetical protein